MKNWHACIISLVALTAGCAKRVEVRTDFCTGWAPIYVGRDDVLSDQTAKAVLQHDRHGVDIGCWKAPAKN